MRKLLAILFLALAIPVAADGQVEKYRRSSLYSVLVTHTNAKYGAEIRDAFLSAPIPDKFNDHNLGLRTFESSAERIHQHGNKKDEQNFKDVEEFVSTNDIARKMVEKWFNRDPETGSFNMELIQERGFYDASQRDIAAAQQTERNLAILGDAGEDLIGKTFLIVNDITFVDKGEQSQIAAAGVGLGVSLLGAILGVNTKDLAKVSAQAINEIDGFKVNITTYLYRLRWNENVGGTFYNEHWINPGEDNPDRKTAFEVSDTLYVLDYIGKTHSSAENLESKSFSDKSKSEQMLRVCARAVDNAVVQLQRDYDEFRVNTPIYKIGEKNTVEVQIGLKEGLNEKSVYEVLMPVEKPDGRLEYRRVGQIKPVKGKIWDNRFGALDEAQELAADRKKVKSDGNAYLNSTTFKILNGVGQIVPGCLVREQTIKNVKQ